MIWCSWYLSPKHKIQIKLYCRFLMGRGLVGVGVGVGRVGDGIGGWWGMGVGVGWGGVGWRWVCGLGWGWWVSGGGGGVGDVSISLQCFDFDAGVKISWRLNIFSHWLIISWPIRNKLQWNFNPNSTFFIKKMHLKMFANCRSSCFSLNVFMMTSSNGKFSALLALCAGNSPVTG